MNHILVVGDDPDVRAVVAQTLRDEGYRVIQAATGREALLFAREDVPRLMVLDIHLPEMDGPAIVDALNAMGRSIPILVLTAAAEARDWATKLGASGYVTKPFTLRALLDEVERLAGRPDPAGPTA